MVTNRRTRIAASALLTLLVVAGLPELAPAQQPLFPNLTVHKRKRPPRESEPPYYRLYRQQYYGYWPTCWRQFPPGWGCAIKDTVPNVAATMEDIRKEAEKRNQAGAIEPQPGMLGPGSSPFDSAPGPREAPDIPALPDIPEGGSPFDLNPNPPGAAPGNGEAQPPAGGNGPFGAVPADDPPPLEMAEGEGHGSLIPDILPPHEILDDPASDLPPPSPASSEVPPLDVPGADERAAFEPPIHQHPRRTLVGALLDNVRGLRRR